MSRLRLFPVVLSFVLLLSLSACDTADPGPEGVALWAGSFTGQSRFGGSGGTWGNGGTYPLVVSANGQVTVSGALIANPTFDEAANVFTWSRVDGNANNGQITFRETDSSVTFADIGTGTVGQSFSGFIRIGNDGPLDYRGVLR